MDWHYVPESTTVRKIAHDEKSKTLWVEFISGHVYKYFKISHQLFEDFLDATSKGSFFNKAIKPNHKYSKVR